MIGCLSRVLRNFVAATALGLAGVGAANAAIFVGSWDPLYGKPFDTGSEILGWRGTATFEIPDACIAVGTVNSTACAGMQLVEAEVEFYDFINGPVVETFTYGATDLDWFSATFGAGGVLTSLTSDFFSSRQPTTDFSFIDLYSFALQFVDGGARMYHTKDYDIGWIDIGPFSPSFCKALHLPSLICGYSGTYSDGTTAPVVHVTYSRVPEPATLALLLTAGLVALAALRRSRRPVRVRGR